MSFTLKCAAVIATTQSLAMHDVNDLIKVFEQCFFKEFNTILVGGGDEPVYLPADQHNPCHRVIFTKDYFSSALHEVAHWCVAGKDRRQLCDYGYWYAPDGRTEKQQQVFEAVEAKPQAIEWILTQATGGRFRVSADNLSRGLGASDAFKQHIAIQAQAYCCEGLAERPKRFARALQTFYKTENPLNSDCYGLACL